MPYTTKSYESRLLSENECALENGLIFTQNVKLVLTIRPKSD